MQLQSEVLDWSLYTNRRKIACLAGMVPSEWSTGDKESRGSITKVGVPALRRIIVEMVWRMVLFQPQYKPVQKWQEVLKGRNPALKKKAVLAIGRQLIVDLWRLQTWNRCVSCIMPGASLRLRTNKPQGLQHSVQ
jgi:transposase